MPNSENKDLASALEVVSGNPTATEIAAVVAVLRESETSNTKAIQAEPNWAKGPQILRGSGSAGDMQWRSDFKGEI